MSTLPYIPKVQLDGVDLFIDLNTLSVTTGTITYDQIPQVNGSQIKVTNIPNFANTFGAVSFTIRMNANTGLANPLLFFKSLKNRHDIKINIFSEQADGVGSLTYSNMTLVNDIANLTLGADSSVSFQFSGEPALIQS
jgi:hypothetical protein